MHAEPDNESESTMTTTTEAPVTPVTPVDESTTVDTPEVMHSASPADDDQPETFPREYVEKLRDENAKYRQRAGQTDDLAKRLHAELVKGTGKLADPSDLPFDDAHLTDADALAAAIDELLTAKPHLASRKPTGDIGQGASPASDGFSLAGLLRGNAS